MAVVPPEGGLDQNSPKQKTFFGDRKGTPRTFATKILPNFRVNFLVRFASKPLFYWVMTRELFRKFFGTVRAFFWLWGSFWHLTYSEPDFSIHETKLDCNGQSVGQPRQGNVHKMSEECRKIV